MTQNNQLETKNGIQLLKELSIPEGALTTLLVVLATLTALPYIAGRNFGPYSIPNVIQGGVFWILTIVPPLLWVILLVKVFGASPRQLKRIAIRLALVELVAVIIALGAMPVTETQLFKATNLAPMRSKSFNMELPAVGHQLTVTVTDVKGASPTFQDVGLLICGELTNSIGDIPCGQYRQVSINTPMTVSLQPGQVQIWVYNYPKDQQGRTQNPLTVTLEAKYLRRLVW